jgi:crotonobetainyl-CoA:carnitine CoA-transferase CaiB-like acyl-CoA transferase
MYAAIVTALLERQRTGRGRLVSTSLLQAGAFTASADLAAEAAHGRVPGQMSRTDSRTPMVNSYRSGDGHWFFLTGVDAERLFPNVCRAIGRPELIGDGRFATAQAIRRNGRELVSILDRAFAERAVEDWAVRFAQEDVWWQPVAAPSEVLKDVQLETNNMLHLIWNGNAAYPMVTSPFGSFRTTSEPLRAPSLGEHTDEILRNLGFDAGSKV